MKSRKVKIALLSLVLTWGGVSAAAGAPARPARAERPRGGVTLWLGWVWNALTPAWAKSRGTMDPDGVAPNLPVPSLPAPTLPVDSPDRSRGTMDPDGVLLGL